MGAHGETSSATIVHAAIIDSAIVNSFVDSGGAGSATADSVIETMKRVSDEALGLIDRRSEINRRIRELHQLLHGLSDLSANAERFAGAAANIKSRPRKHLTDSLPHEGSPCECIAFEHSSLHSRTPKHALARLRRACRIALLEAGGAASLDEIRAFIVRRGSFAFLESGSSHSAILHTLHRMRASGEIRHLENYPQPVWERIMPVEEVDRPS